MEVLLSRSLCPKGISSLCILNRRLISQCSNRPNITPWRNAQNTCLVQRKLHENYTYVMQGKHQQSSRRGLRGWTATFAVTSLFGCLYLGYLLWESKYKVVRMKKKIVTTGKAIVSGPWNLTDHNGVERSDKDFLGQWLLVYFGFTHCPDVCPDELEKVAKVVETLESDKELPNLQPLFVTIDPERDTKDVMKKYCEEFTPTLLGLTGTKEQLDEIYKYFRVYCKLGEKDDTGDYLVDHTIVTFLMKPDGTYADHFYKNSGTEEMIKNVMLRMKRYEKHQK